MVKDPVCGMQINESQAVGRSEYKVKTFYLCSIHCKGAFDKEPTKYAGEGETGSEMHQSHH